MGSDTKSADPQVPSDEELRQEFRTLSMLLTAATTINRGQPSEPSQLPSEKYRGSFERTSNPRELALNAVATLLVRGDESIAVVGHDSQQVFAMQDEVREDRGGREESRFPSIPNFSIITNPNRKKLSRHFPKDEISQCAIAKPGKSHYNLISDSNWKCLTIKKADATLENHLATLVDFIQRHRNAELTQRPGMLSTFHRYMVAVSWRKMHRRVTHDYSIRALGFLTTLTPQNMQHIFKNFASRLKSSGRKDAGLASMLIDLDQQGELQRILDVHLKAYHAAVEPSSINSLVDAFQMVLSSPPREGMGAYNEQTCFPFHLLLVAIISGFKGSLVSLDKATTAESRERYAQLVVQFGHILWRIAYSQMLAHHLELLEEGDFLRTTHKDRHERNSAPSGDEDNEVAEELQQAERDKAVTFRRWIQLLVSYWAATETLAKFSASQVTNGVNISLIRVRGKDHRKMARWDDTIRKLAALPAAADSKDPFDAEAAIALFIEQIGDPRLDAKSVKAFRTTNDPCVVAPPEDVVFIGNIHCELSLVGLLEYPNNVKFSGTKEAAQFIQGANRNFIAVSKLCCPTCWQFLTFVRGNSKTFNVRGRHATMYMVDLPPWVPRGMLEKMVTEFRDRLFRELVLMIKRMAETGSDRDSMESDSCLSTVSNESSPDVTRPKQWISVDPIQD